MVIIIDYKSGDFYLKGSHIEYLVKSGLISDALETYNTNAQIDSINTNAKYVCIYCTPSISPTPTNKDIIMYQLKPFKQYIYCKISN